MLIEALDHGEEDLERRRLVEARVEGERLVLATAKGLAADADLLSAAERADVDAALAGLKSAILAAKSASPVQAAIDSLDHVTHEWAGRRMNRAVAEANRRQEFVRHRKERRARRWRGRALRAPSRRRALEVLHAEDSLHRPKSRGRGTRRHVATRRRAQNRRPRRQRLRRRVRLQQPATSTSKKAPRSSAKPAKTKKTS